MEIINSDGIVGVGRFHGVARFISTSRVVGWHGVLRYLTFDVRVDIFDALAAAVAVLGVVVLRSFTITATHIRLVQIGTKLIVLFFLSLIAELSHESRE